MSCTRSTAVCEVSTTCWSAEFATESAQFADRLHAASMSVGRPSCVYIYVRVCASVCVCVCVCDVFPTCKFMNINFLKKKLKQRTQQMVTKWNQIIHTAHKPLRK